MLASLGQSSVANIHLGVGINNCKLNALARQCLSWLFEVWRKSRRVSCSKARRLLPHPICSRGGQLGSGRHNRAPVAAPVAKLTFHEAIAMHRGQAWHPGTSHQDQEEGPLNSSRRACKKQMDVGHFVPSHERKTR